MALPPDARARSFRDIEFGFADARKEGAEAPELLLHGFFDDSRLTDEALSGSSFLFLGYKGSGKTALAERARLLGERDPTLFVTTTSLEEFPYGDFKSLADGPGEAHSRYPTVWAWLLLLSLIQSLERDEQGRVNAPSPYTRTLHGLQRLSLLPLPRLNQLVSSSSRSGFISDMPKFFDDTDERVAETPDLQLVQMVRLLRDAVMQFPTTSRHVLFIDGLDEILTQQQLQFEALAALVSQASKLNDDMRAAGKPFKVVVLCRTDIFDRLPGANKNKIRRDSSEALEWFDDPRDPDRTRLAQLVNLRAQRSLPRELNVFDEFFPATVDERPVRRFLLEHTRHLPRDVLQLMKSMQRFAPAADSGRLSEEQVKSGIRDYSNDYFLPELRDELHGYLDSAAIDVSVKLLASLAMPRFTMEDLKRQADRLRVGSVDLDRLVHTLFECSGVGMIDQRGPGRPIVTFKYRNRNAMLIPGMRILVHPGAWKALNIQARRRVPAASKGSRRASRGARGA